MEQFNQAVAYLPVEQVLSATSPAWILALLLAGLNVSIFQSIAGRDLASAVYFVPAGLFGFAFGNLVAVLVGSPLPPLGDVHVIEASIAAWASLSLTNARLSV